MLWKTSTEWKQILCEIKHSVYNQTQMLQQNTDKLPNFCKAAAQYSCYDYSNRTQVWLLITDVNSNCIQILHNYTNLPAKIQQQHVSISFTPSNNNVYK